MISSTTVVALLIGLAASVEYGVKRGAPFQSSNASFTKMDKESMTIAEDRVKHAAQDVLFELTDWCPLIVGDRKRSTFYCLR